MNKQVLNEICARLRYGVHIIHSGWNFEWDDELSTVERVTGIDEKFVYTKVVDTRNGEEYREDRHSIDLSDDKLLLRPMSDMTEEECDEVENILGAKCIFDFMTNGDIVIRNGYYTQKTIAKLYEFFYSRHLDINGLIDDNLAIDCSKMSIYDLKKL